MHGNQRAYLNKGSDSRLNPISIKISHIIAFTLLWLSFDMQLLCSRCLVSWILVSSLLWLFEKLIYVENKAKVLSMLAASLFPPSLTCHTLLYHNCSAPHNGQWYHHGHWLECSHCTHLSWTIFSIYVFISSSREKECCGLRDYDRERERDTDH